jgi:hypothetical protein
MQNTARMHEILEAEQQTDKADLCPQPCGPCQARPRKAHSKCKYVKVLSDPEDVPYASTLSLSMDSESDSSVVRIMPDEVRFTPLDCHLH